MISEDEQRYIRSMSLDHTWMEEKEQLLWSKTGPPKVEDSLNSDARIYPLALGSSGTSGSSISVLAHTSEPLSGLSSCNVLYNFFTNFVMMLQIHKCKMLSA
ncbi:hypothetical protein AVEN_210459-1 [Araneus ventricosus]|uniref:Uncharacterized protein n=1 Tax=Araneus ventricosus TaxID=182803 RepID=A0A4Y2HSI8_ARAVE|nr:hypothetical protein AVEN_210459-1 [Araneus ventricosus]